MYNEIPLNDKPL